ncbi:HpcH/HpaI aldolase/citrate lyase family protein [Aliarcobacter butzleri]|uniref:HpcH/HpaI aldolase/citrate lyase family protein n=1 Tax=Aliarcobacter butzleri TaxID=28197 RepID=UPI0021B1CA36|nr:HpcH/HpaI aldolase/citrate lyase family protein [Aliarcobacter butzleri]MCT7646451.1 HpcH/HpaI aldolase/citrate lyase family protein [Aliarcobacter butzleri]
MNFMIIENDLELIKKYDSIGVDRIFIDLEILGKKERQGHLDTVISEHSIEDIKKIKPHLNNSKLLVRINPINMNSRLEIDTCIGYGADIIMLPMFKTKKEVETFISFVNKRAKVCLLLETTQALCRIDDILELNGIDEIHIGLNDLHLAMNLNFMFELLSGGIVDYLSNKIKNKNIPFGFGGIATLDSGMISGEMILKEHIRLNSSMVILSRAFKNAAKEDFSKFEKEFLKLTYKLEELKKDKNLDFDLNMKEIKKAIDIIVLSKGN